MAVTDRCRTALRNLEPMVRDDHMQADLIQRACTDVFLIDGKKPTLMEEVELLDTFVNYFSPKSDDETKTRVFTELFPLDREIFPDRLQFLIKISSLAIYLGHNPLLDLIAVWLKVRIAYLFAAALYPPTMQSITSMYHTISSYVSGTVTDLLSIPKLPCGPQICLNAPIKMDEGCDEHPLAALPTLSSAFVDALLSGITLIYGHAPSLVSMILKNNPKEVSPIGQPPAALVHCIILWLQVARTHPRSHHSSGSHGSVGSWASVDWPGIIRRYKFHTHLPSSAEPVHTHCPPIPIGLAWWTLFWPIYTEMRRDPEEKLLAVHMAELHYELLLCLSEGSPNTTGHRHSSVGVVGGCGSSGSGGSSLGSGVCANWIFPCSRKLERTREFACLELLIQRVLTCIENAGISSKSNSEDSLTPETLMIIRLSEFMQLAWAGGRIWNLSTDEFAKLLAPLSGHKVIDLVRARFKRV
ncbi:unnamed protein product [Echinostoma caproni]|uniref:Rap-GAP domain-containing protein n=1 Tax=Echinostoma caproni TaxID=27848 RepID=A0A183AD24_9TREM|nr:unnamed protein product [Echinostoma caproni]